MISTLDKLYYVRVVLGVATGVAAEGIFGTDYFNGVTLGLLSYLMTFYLAKLTFGKNLPKEQVSKLYTTGVGTFAMMYLFFWILLFTLGFHYLALAV